jgi:hypothetical protein
MENRSENSPDEQTMTTRRGHPIMDGQKDSIDTAGVLTQRGSPIFKGPMPEADATSVAGMKKAGGIAGLLKHRRQDPQKYLREGECADRCLSSYQSVFETTTSSAVKPTSSVSSSQKQGVYYAVCTY